MPSSQVIQWGLLGLMAILFALAFVLGLRHMREAALADSQGTKRRTNGAEPPATSMGLPARTAVLLATLMGIALLAWRAIALNSFLLPVSDPFDAFLLLGLLLAFVVVYFRWTRHLQSLSFFLLPMIAIILLIGLFLSIANPAANHEDYQQIWTLLHVLAIVAGSFCFALGCVGGIVYLLADRQLRHRGGTTPRWFGYPPLASIEKFNRWMIYVGFPLLTVATVAGILRIAQTHASGDAGHAGLGQMFKIVCGILAWTVYGVLVHVPLTPSFRGKRAAWLSVVGFALFIGAFVAARWN
jgi:ABC-type uncharacterized transport system permease subunit